MTKPVCYGCATETARFVAARRACVERGAHRPVGEQVEHEHVRAPLFRCGDCGTLVAKVA